MSTKKLVYGKAARSNSKQSVSNSVSVRKRFSSLCTVSNNQPTNCVFCQKFRDQPAYSFSPLLNKALFSKYSSSQNYYYSKDINDILENESTPAVIFYKDLETVLEDEEYMKRVYTRKESSQKQKALLEYYKYHHDIPRLFMNKVYVTINKFHEKKRRIQYAQIKRKLNIADEEDSLPKKKPKLKQNKSDEDQTVGQMKHLLKDLNLESSSYLKKNNVSSSILLKEFVQLVGQRYDQLGQISGLLSIDQTQSIYLGKNDVSVIKQKNTINRVNYIPNLKSKLIPQKSVITKQLVDSKLNKQSSQLSHQSSFEKVSLKLLQHQDKVESKGETSRKSDQIGSPFRNQPTSKKVYQSIEGFTNFVQKQQQILKASYKPVDNVKKLDHSRKISGNFNSSDNQLRLPSRQNTALKQPDLQTYQQNFIKNRLASHFTSLPANDEDQALSPLKVQTDRPQVRCDKSGRKLSTNSNSKLVQQKFTSYAISTLKNLQIKSKEEVRTQKSQPTIPVPGHFRTKSTDMGQTQKGSPPKHVIHRQDSITKDPMKLTHNVFVQGASNKRNVYNINQNNIVNIYIEDLKNSNKTIGTAKYPAGSQTARVSSPLKTQGRQIFDCYNSQKTNYSPTNRKRN